MAKQHNTVRILQTSWLLIATFSFFNLIVGLPTISARYQVGCDQACLWGQLPEESFQQLLRDGADIELIFAVLLIALVCVRCLEIILGGVLIWKGTHDWYALLWGFIVTTTSMSTADFRVALPPWMVGFYDAVGLFNMIGFPLAIISFPDGKFKPRWTLALAAVFYVAFPFVLRVIPNLLDSVSALSVLLNLVDLSFVVFVFGVVGHRYISEFSQLQRQQVKWLVYALAMNVCIFLVLDGVVPLLVAESHPYYLLASKFIGMWVIGFFFIALIVSILQYRLWDIDIIIHRTLVYGFMTGFVVACYSAIVSGLGALIHNSDQFMISVIATAIIALLFQPLREKWQRVADRMLFGDRNNPYGVISRLSERLESNDISGTLLPGIAETLAQALKLSYVSIAIEYDGGFKTDVVYGQPADHGRITSFPLSYGSESVGKLVIGQVAGDRILSPAEHQLLENIARQTGVAVHALHLNIALMQSRQHIISAREEERRRLRRDLHDGLGPALASHTVKIGAARMLIDSDPQTAHHILEELENNLANSLMDIRRLVYNLRPPALDQLGFLPALYDFLQQCNGRTQFTLQAPEVILPMPAAVEVACYRIIQEAVNNVIRHDMAKHCLVEISVNSTVEISIHDDGVGFPSNFTYGVGLKSMSERAEELGGTLSISDFPNVGTFVHVRIPL